MTDGGYPGGKRIQKRTRREIFGCQGGNLGCLLDWKNVFCRNCLRASDFEGGLNYLAIFQLLLTKRSKENPLGSRFLYPLLWGSF